MARPGATPTNKFSGGGGDRAARQRRGCTGYGGADNERNIQSTSGARWQQFSARRGWTAPAKL
eukprot:3667964-Pyramimonas_sp.AAC.1